MSRSTLAAPVPAAPRVRPSAEAPLAVAAAPRMAALWACAVYALCTLVLAWPIFTGQFLVNPFSDEYIAGYAFREYGASTLRETGGFPLWNPYLFGGMPFVAAMHGDIFYPVAVALRWIFPTDVAMSLGFVVHTFLCGVFTYAFLRSMGVGFWGSLVGGLAYLLSGPIASYPSPGHDGKLYVSAILPLTLLLLVRVVRDGRLWAVGALALAVGFAVLSPHPQMLQYMLLASGAFALYLALADHGAGALPRSVAFRRLGLALGAVVIGGLIGAVQYLPVREYVSWSPRAGGKGWEHAVSYSMPTEEMINMYLPQFSGLLDRYWGRNGIHLHSEYLGVVTLMLAGLAFGSNEPVRRRFTRFWLGALVVAVLWALGGSTPFYTLVYHLVPGTKFFRAPSMILYIVAFSTAVLAALGTERALAGAVRPRYLIGWGVAGLVMFLLAAAGALTNLAVSITGPELYDYVAQNQGAVVLGAVRSLVLVVLAAAVLAALSRGRLPSRTAAIALVALAAVDLWSIARHYWRWSGPASEIYASDETIEYVKRQPVPGRVLAIPLSQANVAPHDVFLTGDGLMSHRVRNVLGYHGNELGRYDVLFGKESGGANVANPKFWQLANVRYLLTAAPESPIPGSTRLVGPVRNAAGSTVYLYSIPGDNPPAWVAPVIVKAPDDVALATIMNPGYTDVRRAAIFDTSAKVTAQAVVKTLPAPLQLTANVTRYDPGHITITLSEPAPAGSALVVSENYYPGWTATVDGKPAPTGRVNFVLIGVELPAGARQVELRFASAPYETGEGVTLASAGLAMLLIAGGAVADRRRRV